MAHRVLTLVEKSRRPLVMGIVNVTPDSFSDGGSFADADAAAAHALKLIDDGADVIDIGGESTRPAGATYGVGAQPVDEDEELARVIPVIARVRRARPDVLISIDTMKPSVAERALGAGADIINDVSAGRYDGRMFDVAAAAGAPIILMHGHDPHTTVNVDDIHCDDIVADVAGFLGERVALARSRGVEAIIGDVGIGFAKRFDDNIRLLREHARFAELGIPMLIGASRKAFIGRLLSGAPAAERDIGSLAAHAAAVTNGASIVRVHDVRSSVQFLTVLSALTGAATAG